MPHYKVTIDGKEVTVLATNPDAAKSTALHSLSQALLKDVTAEEVDVGRDTTAFSGDFLPPQEEQSGSGPKDIGRVSGEVISREEAVAEGQEKREDLEEATEEERESARKADEADESEAQAAVEAAAPADDEG